jgi:hypothetical protein
MSINYSSYPVINKYFAVNTSTGTITSNASPYTITPSTFPSAPNYYYPQLTSGSISGGTLQTLVNSDLAGLTISISTFIMSQGTSDIVFTAGQTTTITPGTCYAPGVTGRSTLTLPATSTLEFNGAGTYVIYAQEFIFNGTMILSNGATATNIFFQTRNDFGGTGNITFNASNPLFNYYGIYLCSFRGAMPGGQASITVTSGRLDGCLINSSPGAIALNNSFFQSETLCFLKGTRILTKDGYKLIEDLGVGDKVVSYGSIINDTKVDFHEQSSLSSITWIQHFSPVVKNTESYPIRFSKGSLGSETPSHDLWVSPGHRIIVDGKMNSAINLVNGTTIVQDMDMEDIEYYHFETESHEVIDAEGMKAETFINFDYSFRNQSSLSNVQNTQETMVIEGK